MIFVNSKDVVPIDLEAHGRAFCTHSGSHSAIPDRLAFLRCKLIHSGLWRAQINQVGFTDDRFVIHVKNVVRCCTGVGRDQQHESCEK